MHAHPSRYSFGDYDPHWPARFEQERRLLQNILTDLLADVHHIGSTSVPGLAAKPVIDLLPVVFSIHVLDEHADELLEAGYRCWGEHGLPGRRLFTRDHNGLRTHNVHAYEQHHPDIERHLAFVAFLRATPARAREYEHVKRAAFQEHPTDIAAYSAFKHDWITRIEPLALEWFRQRQDH